MLLVATETGVDHAKPVSIFVHDLLGIGRRCRVYELKHACYAGTAALMTAADWVRAGGGRARRALVIAADIARYEIGSPGEPTQGAGAVAMLVGRAPQALVLSEQSGTYAGNVHDFWRPLDRRARSRARSWPTVASSGRRSPPARRSPTAWYGSSTTRPSPRWR